MSFEFLYHNRLKNAPKVKDESANRQIRLSDSSYRRGSEKGGGPTEKEVEKDVQDGGSSVFSDDNEPELQLPPEVVRYETLSKSSIRRMQELREEIEQGKRYRRENEPDRKKQQNPLEWEKVKGKRGFRRSGSVESEDSMATNSDDLKDFATVRRQLEQNLQRAQPVGTPRGKENEPSSARTVSFDPNVDVRKIPRDEYPSNNNDYHDMVEELKSLGGKTMVIEPEKRVIPTKQQSRTDGGILTVVSDTPRSQKEAPTSHGSYTISTQRPQAPVPTPTSPQRVAQPQRNGREVRPGDARASLQTNNGRHVDTGGSGGGSWHPVDTSGGTGGSWHFVQNGVQVDTGEAVPPGARIEYSPDGRMWVYARHEHVQWTTVHLTDSTDNNFHPAPVSPRLTDHSDHRPRPSPMHNPGMTDNVPHLTIRQSTPDHSSVIITDSGNIKGRNGKTIVQTTQTKAPCARAGVSLPGTVQDGFPDTPQTYQNGHVTQTDYTEEKSINFQSDTDSFDSYKGYFHRDDYAGGYRNDVELERVRQGMEMSMDFVHDSRKIPNDEFVGW